MQQKQDEELTTQKLVERVGPDLEVLFVGATIPDQSTLDVVLWGQWAETQTY